jgi:uncharacterized SAM-binding protein YcdF (DUF218 family)
MRRRMNSLVVALGIESWKAIVAVLVLPPVPFLVLIVVGAWLLPRRRGVGWTLVLGSVVGIWISCCAGVSVLIEHALLKPPPPLTAAQIADLKQRAKAGRAMAIVVLGGGHEALAPEYGTSNLAVDSAARLRYGIWLSRQTGVPVAYSGGAVFGSADGSTEAEAAARIALRDHEFKLRWIETDARDTRENAVFTIRKLKQDRVQEILLVSHGWHLPRGLRNFERVAGNEMRIVAAPMSLAPPVERRVLRWLPTSQGYFHMHMVLHELLGLLTGA